MIAKYRLIQFVGNALYPAPVTVGVIARIGSRVELRLLGINESHETTRAGAYLRAFRLEDESEGVVREWLHWFRSIASEQLESGEDWHASLADLGLRGGPFIADEEGESEIEADQLASLVDQIYRQSVFLNPTVSIACLEDAAEELLDQEGILENRNNIDQDAEIELLPKRGVGTGLLYFPWFYDDGTRKVGFKVISFGQDQIAVGRQVSEVLNAFEVAVGRKLLDRTGCVVFHDSSIARFSQYEKWLGQSATLLNLDAPDLREKIRALI